MEQNEIWVQLETISKVWNTNGSFIRRIMSCANSFEGLLSKFPNQGAMCQTTTVQRGLVYFFTQFYINLLPKLLHFSPIHLFKKG